MAVSDAVRGALKKGKISQKELAKRWGKLPQAINNKLRQYSWTGEELAGIAEMTGGKLAFVYPDGAEIPVEAGPTKAGKAVRAKKPQTVQKTEEKSKPAKPAAGKKKPAAEAAQPEKMPAEAADLKKKAEPADVMKETAEPAPMQKKTAAEPAKPRKTPVKPAEPKKKTPAKPKKDAPEVKEEQLSMFSLL